GVQHTPPEVLARFSVGKHVPMLLEHHPLADSEQYDRVHELLDTCTVLAGYVTKDLDLPQIGDRVRLQPVAGGDLRAGRARSQQVARVDSVDLFIGETSAQRLSLALTDLRERRVEHVAERPSRLGCRLLKAHHEQ